MTQIVREGEAERGEVLLKETMSICPECNRVIPGRVVEKNNRVYLKKECPEHGKFEELYYGDAEIYRRFARFAHDGKGTGTANVKIIGYTCPGNCGLCPGHLSHTALANIVVTNRCDLYCWYCLPPDEELLVKDGDKVRLLKIEEFASLFFKSLHPK